MHPSTSHPTLIRSKGFNSLLKNLSSWVMRTTMHV